LAVLVQSPSGDVVHILQFWIVLLVALRPPDEVLKSVSVGFEGGVGDLLPTLIEIHLQCGFWFDRFEFDHFYTASV
jgi:hypothetical protein